MTLTVVDSSAVVAALVESGPPADWASVEILRAETVAPAVMPFEVGDVLRRRARAGVIDPADVTLAHRDLMDMRAELWPHSALAERAWQLRDTCTYNDACFVALAELLDAPLLTLDLRLTRTTGPRCEFLTPPAG